MAWELSSVRRLLFGRGCSQSVQNLWPELGSRPLVITGRNPERGEKVLRGYPTYVVTGEPSLDMARAGAAFCRSERCNVVVGIGGGSAMDAAKAIAALAANPGDVLDYLEVIGQGKPLPHPPLPVIAVPTTAGTGAEVTRNAVLFSPEAGVKASLRNPLLLPSIAVVDPDLTVDLPAAITASTGLDALTQLIEPFTSVRANAMVDMYCLEGMSRVARSLQNAYRNGGETAAREDMSFASLLSGLSLANAGLGIVHGFAAAIGGGFDVPHGAVCAALLPYAMQTNIEALRRAARSEALGRFRKIASTLTGKQEATEDDGVTWVRQLCAELEIAPLHRWGLDPTHVQDLVAKAQQASSTKSNPIQLSLSEMTELLRAAL